MAATHRSKAWRRDANLIIRPINPAGRARLFPLHPASAAEGVGGGLVIESGLYQIMSGAILSLATQRGGPNQRRVGASGQQGLYFHCSLTDGTKSNDGVNSISFSSDFLSLSLSFPEARNRGSSLAGAAFASLLLLLSPYIQCTHAKAASHWSHSEGRSPRAQERPSRSPSLPLDSARKKQTTLKTFLGNLCCKQIFEMPCE